MEKMCIFVSVIVLPFEHDVKLNGTEWPWKIIWYIKSFSKLLSMNRWQIGLTCLNV